MRCETCPNPCTTCLAEEIDSSNWEVKCLGCAVGYLLQSGRCTYICEDGTFANYLDDKTQCSACLSQCTQCFIEEDICSACDSGYLLDSEQSACLFGSTCVPGYYKEAALNLCAKCHYPCKTCDQQPNQCTSCLKGALHDSACPLYCPDNMFIDYSVTNTACVACVSPCVTCLSASTCLTCEPGTFFYLGACAASCPSTFFYPNSGNHTCTKCVSPCSECLSASQCLSCRTGFIDLTLNKCLLECNSSSYVDESFACRPCSPPCVRCYAETGGCLQCELPFVLHND